MRAKKTFFLDSRFFIAIATVAFIFYVAEATYSDLSGMPVTVSLDTVLIAIMGVSTAIASYLLQNNNQARSSSATGFWPFLRKPPRSFQIFLSVILFWMVASIVSPPTIQIQTGSSGQTYYLIYSLPLIALGIALVASFIGLPVLSFYRQSKVVKEKTASLSIKIISLCWALFSVSLFLQIVGGEWLPSTQSLGFVADSLLFILIAFALREPTILARIITSGETVSQAISIQSDEDTIILYDTESDRRKLIERFVAEGMSKGQTVLCRVTKSEVPFYRAILKSVEVGDPMAGKQDVIVQPIEVAASLTQSIARPADIRELIDLDELSLERSKEIIDEIDEVENTAEKTRNGRIWALNVESAQTGIVGLLTKRNPASRVIDLAKQQDSFSARLGLKHQDTLGQRILLEYEPTSDYESLVREFVREFQANVESVAVFTNAGSPVYRGFSEQRNVRFFTLSTKTSTPVRLNNDQVLLPERDTSLFLDAVDKLLQAQSGKPIGIVFDVFTYLILSLGFEKAYGVISSVVEMTESEHATILVIINYEALESRTLNGLRGLFQSQLRMDSNGVETLRFSGDEVAGGTPPQSEPGGQEFSRRVEA